MTQKNTITTHGPASGVEYGLRVLGAADVQTILQGQEAEIVRRVADAYKAHYQGSTSLPHSSFLRFPQAERNRIIGLPAFLGEPFHVAGMKWIASYPDNVARGLPRASALMVLNDLETGFPTAVLEAGAISAKRTAASAALAARLLHAEAAPTAVALVGAGRINSEILTFLRVVFPSLTTVYLYDSIAAHAERFVRQNAAANLSIHLLERAEHAPQHASLVSLATTASVPYFEDDGTWGDGCTVLHISLRDLSPSTIIRSVNFTDDVDHACRERTSLHLTELQLGHRDFVAGTLERALLHPEPVRSPSDRRPIVFSPFGLGILDLAVASLVVRRAIEEHVGVYLPSFTAANTP